MYGRVPPAVTSPNRTNRAARGTRRDKPEKAIRWGTMAAERTFVIVGAGLTGGAAATALRDGASTDAWS